eukprot:4262324-Pyramimonas_sp.AAC.1
MSAKDQIGQDATGTVRGLKSHPNEFPTQDDKADWRRKKITKPTGAGTIDVADCLAASSSSLMAPGSFLGRAGLGAQVALGIQGALPRVWCAKASQS